MTKVVGYITVFIKQAEILLPGEPKCNYLRTDNGSGLIGAMYSYSDRRGNMTYLSYELRKKKNQTNHNIPVSITSIRNVILVTSHLLLITLVFSLLFAPHYLHLFHLVTDWTQTSVVRISHSLFLLHLDTSLTRVS